MTYWFQNKYFTHQQYNDVYITNKTLKRKKRKISNRDWVTMYKLGILTSQADLQ